MVKIFDPKNLKVCNYKEIFLLVWSLLFVIYISKVNLATLVKDNPQAPFSIATTPREGTTPFPDLLHFILDPHLIMLRIKQGSTKYYFLSLWYDLTWDWTLASQTIGEHSTHKANGPVYKHIIYIYIYIYIYICYILTFDPAQKCNSKVIHRKEVTHSNGQ